MSRPGFPPFRARAGFTLLEVMVASTIAVLVIFSVIGGFMGAIETKEAFEEARETSHTAVMILDRFRQEMASAYLSNLGATEPDSDPGYTGFSGRHNRRGSHDMDEVQFTTLNHVTIPDVVSSDHAEIGYRADHDARLETDVLFHREDQTPDFEFSEGGVDFLMASGIAGFSLRYFDGVNNDWRSEWDAAQSNNMLPMIVRAEITFTTQRGKEMSFSTVVKVYQAFEYIKKQRQKTQ